jgi:hypothetical protein
LKVVSDFPDMAKEQLDLATKDEQLKLLSQVLQASDADALEEDTKDELIDGIPSRVSFWSIWLMRILFFKATRKEVDLAAFSGANAISYAAQQKGTKRNADERHPLFKRFRKWYFPYTIYSIFEA